MKGLDIGKSIKPAFDPDKGADKKTGVGIKDKQGNLRGSNFTVPKGDFAQFLGYQKPTDQEMSGKAQLSGDRIIEVALQKQFRELGTRATSRGNKYRNMSISMGAYRNKPGRTGDMLKDGLDAINASVEENQAMGVRYLEMQYKFWNASKSFSTVSNLMKVRHESIKKSMNDIK